MRAVRQHIPYSIEFTDTVGEQIDCGDNLDKEYTDAFSWSGKLFIKDRSGVQGVMSKRLSSNPFTGWAIRLNSGNLEFSLRGTTAANNLFVNTDDDIPLNEWFDFVITYDGSGDASGVKMYVNGDRWAATASSDAFDDTSALNSAELFFGYDGVTAANILNGFLTDFRLHNAELTADQALDAHNGHFVSVEAHWPMTDGVGSTVTETEGAVNGTLTDATWSRFSPSLAPVANRHIPYSLNFDGNNNEVEFGDNLDKERTDSFSFSWWMYSRSDDTRSIFAKRTSGNGAGYEVIFLNTSRLAFDLEGSNGNFLRVRITDAVALNQWVHFTVTYDGSGNASGVKWYRDGRLVDVTTDSDNLDADITNSATLHMGLRTDNSTDYDGLTTDFRVHNDELTADEVWNLYAKNISVDVEAHWPMDEGSGTTLNDNVGSVDGTITNASWSRFTPMLARRVVPDIDHSLYFNGVNANVNMGDVLDKERTDSFSFSFWLRPEGTVSHSILSKRTGGNGAGYEVLFLNSGVLGFVLEGSNGNALNVSVDHDVQAKEWHYYTVTYDGSGAGSGVDWYIDGRKVNVTISADDLTTDITNSEDFLLGLRAGSTIELKGFLTDVRVHNAKLTSDEAWDLYAKNIAVDVEAHWDFAEGLGTTLTDQVGSFNGTITDAAWSHLTP